MRTWAMWGTLHLLPAKELPRYVAALSNRRFDLDGPWLEYHGVESAEVAALIDAVGRALDGRRLTRDGTGRVHRGRRLRPGRRRRCRPPGGDA